LEGEGVNVSDAVKFIAITHWHDDHIRGMAGTVNACTSAQVCLSSALRQREFIEAMYVRETASPGQLTSGLRELRKTFDILHARGTPPVFANANQIVFGRNRGELSHGSACEIRAISPSSAQFELALSALAALMPSLGETRRRAVDQGENDLSVATWISVGDIAVLLGADLEERNDPRLGWAAVAALPAFPNERAEIFKIPHHGSSTGHHEGIWRERVIKHAIAVLTPWSRGGGLPTLRDVERIQSFTDNGYSTSTGLRRPRGKSQYKAVEKQLREMGTRIVQAQPPIGHVRMRKKIGGSDWGVELFGSACSLTELHKLKLNPA